MSQTTRAKFKCNGINLTASSRPNPEVVEALGGDASDYRKITAKADELGVPSQVPFDQPTVVLNPVYAGPGASEEDKAFWESSPSGRIELTISNPNAAQVFELHKTYYVDFTLADQG